MKILDFSKSRVRQDGVLMTKFDMAYAMLHLDYDFSLPYYLGDNVFSYKEVKDAFLSLAQRKGNYKLVF